jgi:hypothetical protein
MVIPVGFRELENYTTERTEHPMTWNYLFMGSEAAGHSNSIVDTKIATCGMNEVDTKARQLSKIQDHSDTHLMLSSRVAN